MEGFDAAAALLPGSLRGDAVRLPAGTKNRCEELRLRLGRNMMVLAEGRESPVSGGPVTGSDLRSVLEAATRSSMHAATEALRRGYIAAPGGVRVGVCGTAVMGPTGMEGLRAISSLSLRIPRAVEGCADGIWSSVTKGGFQSLLILSPPGAGKTTLLRELVRRLSEAGYRVSVADERAELWGGGGFDLGPHTDVMTGAPKSDAAAMLLRSMNPQILAMDEVTDPADARALLHAAGCGVELLATVHGTSVAEIQVRLACRDLFAAGAFRRCVTVENDRGRRRYKVEDLS